MSNFKFRAGVWGAVLVIAALAFFAVLYFRAYLHPQAQRMLSDISWGWMYCTDGDTTLRPLDYPARVSGVEPGETMYMTRTLREEGDVLLLKYYYQKISVRLNGRQLFTNLESDRRNPGVGLVFLPVTDMDRGAVLELVISSPYRIYAGSACPVYLGDTPSLMAMLFSNALPRLFFLFVCTLIGFFFLTDSVWSIFRHKSQWSYFFLGLFSVLLGFFCICREDLVYLIFPPLPASLLGIALHMVYLIPLMAYFYCYIHTHKRLVRVILILLCAGAAGVFLIQMLGAADLPDMLPVINLVVAVSFLPIIGIVIYEMLHGSRVIRFLFPIIILVIVCSAGTVLFYYEEQKASTAMYLNTVILLVICIWIYHLREFAHQLVAEKKELQALQFQNERTRKDYETIMAHMEEVRMIRHEIGHHVAALRILNDKGEHDRLTKYLDAVAEQITRSTAPYTGNLLVNCILSDRLGRAKEMRIRLETEIDVPSTLPVEDPDLCSLLTNLLDNAIEANHRLAAESRWLRLQICLKGAFLVILCANASPGPLGAGRRSGKTGDHGYGIPIMRSIAKKYGSVLQIEQTEDSFCVKTALQLPCDIQPEAQERNNTGL